MTRKIVPDQVLERPEPLAEAEGMTRVPSAPFAFMWYLIRKHFLGRVIVLVLLAASATSVEAFGPYALSRLINAITAAVETRASFSDAILPWLGLLAAIALAVFLGFGTYLWWKLRQARRHASVQVQQSDVIEGVVFREIKPRDRSRTER